MMTDLRKILIDNFEKVNVDKIQSRWCSGDSPDLFKERWEKLFEDWVGVKKEKVRCLPDLAVVCTDILSSLTRTPAHQFDPSRVSELYDSLKYDSLHNRVFLFAIFDPLCGSEPIPTVAPRDRRLHELVDRAKLLFDLVAPQEYGVRPACSLHNSPAWSDPARLNFAVSLYPRRSSPKRRRRSVS